MPPDIRPTGIWPTGIWPTGIWPITFGHLAFEQPDFGQRAYVQVAFGQLHLAKWHLANCIWPTGIWPTGIWPTGILFSSALSFGHCPISWLPSCYTQCSSPKCLFGQMVFVQNTWSHHHPQIILELWLNLNPNFWSWNIISIFSKKWFLIISRQV